MKPSPWRLARVAMYLALTLPLMPVQALFLALRSRFAIALPVAYHRLCWRILGLRVAVRGTMSARQPTLFVSNHVSYLDITLLAGLIPGSFIAKTEVAGWPLFGQLARLQRTVFVDRQARSMAEQRSAVAERLAAGDSLILFPEGTSGDGQRVLPFKSALFSAAETPAEGAPVLVQPVSITYVRLDGMPMGRAIRPFVAWYGDMELGPHLWALLGLGVVTAAVEFHPVVSIAGFSSRKTLAEHCRQVVAEGVALALSGRERPSAAPPAAHEAAPPAAAAASA